MKLTQLIAGLFEQCDKDYERLTFKARSTNDESLLSLYRKKLAYVERERVIIGKMVLEA